VEPLCRFAGRDLVMAALCHDDGHVEARHGANQVCGGELGQQRGL
jgi:predicted HD phosphohydrolase